MTERLTAPYVFCRYVNGREMAEGVTIRHATSLEEASQKAAALCREPNTLLVLDNEAGRKALEER